MDRFAEQGVADYMGRVPYFAHLTGPQKDFHIAVGRWLLGWSLRIWIDGDAWMTAEEVEFTRRLAVRRVKEGCPLEVLVAACLSWFRSFPAMVESSAADLLEPGEAADLALMSFQGYDAYVQVLAPAYHAAEDRLARDGEGARKQFLADVLRGWPASDAILARSAESAGVSLPPDPALVTIAAARSPLRAPRADDLAGVIDVVQTTYLRGPLVEDQGSVLQALDRSTAAVVASTEVARAIARGSARQGWYVALMPVADWSGCGVAHQRAFFALRVAPSWAFTGRRTLTDSDVHLLAMVRGESVESAEAIRREILGGLLAPENEVLRETLEAYLEASSIREAAARLRVHAQTLRYRLGLIHELTGRDLHAPWDNFVLRLESALGLGVPGRAERPVGGGAGHVPPS